MGKIAEYLIYLYVFFMVIDSSGEGSLTKVPFVSLSIKYCILLVLLAFFVFRLFRWTLEKIWPANYFSRYLTMLICFAVFYVSMGLLRGNEFNYVLKDSFGLLYYSVGFLIIPFLDRKEQIFNILKVLFISTLTVNAFLIITEIILIQNVIPVDLVNMLIVGNKLGLYIGNIANTPFYRIALRAGIFVQMGAVMAFSLIFVKGIRASKLYILYLFTGLAGLFILFSRGNWLGFLVSAFVVMLYNIMDKNVKAMLVALFAIAAIGSISIGVSNIRFESAFADRFFSSFNFIEDESNLIRAEQFEMLNNKFLEHPFIGGGYGTYIEGYSRDTDQPYYFELDYLAMLMKFGIVGFAVLVGLFFNILRAEYIAIINAKDKKIKAVGIGMFASVIGLFITAATNPYMNGLLGNFIVLFSMAIFNVIMNNEKMPAVAGIPDQGTVLKRKDLKQQ